MQIATNAFEAVISKDTSPSKAFDILNSDDYDNTIGKAWLVSEANTLSLSQAIYSLSDVMAYTIAYSTDLYKIIEKPTLKTIHKKLKSDSTLKTSIIDMLGLKEYQYLKNLVNKSKHVSLVSTSYSTTYGSHTRGQHGLKFKPFLYADREHPEKWFDEFFHDASLINKKYIVILEELCKYLK